MNVIYVCKVSSFQAAGNQIDIPKKVGTDFFNVPLENIENSKNIGINICHISDLRSFEIIEIQPATNLRWSTKLNKFLSEKGERLNEGDLLIFEKLGRSYCVRTISNGDDKYDALIEFFDEDEKHLLLSSSIEVQSKEKDEIKPDLLPYLTALRTKPFLLLAGISGTGKSRIVRELAFASCPKKLQDNDGTTPGNYCMIEVKPNWHDSSELLGYYSNISKKYIFTKFVKFLVKAKMYPDVPFFVCLDEMNLAPVEQYFAEYLSVLETRKKAENEIKTGVLVSNEHFKNLNLSQCKNNKDIYLKLFELNSAEEIDDSVANQSDLLTLGLTLPDNVFVIGTVNMDDTTHQFSRKVIDRAMTIEMNGGDLMGMFGGSAKLSYREENDLLPLGAFRPSYVNADEVLDAHTSCAEQIKQLTTDKLNAINACLKNTPFVVSYRVLNELVIYLGNLLDDNGYKADGNDDTFKTFVDTAVDRITLMKILPRVEGDEDMFRIENESQNRLEKLQNLFSPSVSKNEEETLEVNDKGNDVEVQKENIEDKKTDDSSNSYQKLKDMIERLESGFTRFWP